MKYSEWVEDDCDFAVVPVMPEGYDRQPLRSRRQQAT